MPMLAVRMTRRRIGLDGGRQVEGFEWVRVASIPDTQCRES